MATSFDVNARFKHVDPKTKSLISGYIRIVQILFPQNVAFYNIPSYICDICCVFYWIPNPVKLKLSVGSYRGCLGDYESNSPKCMLTEGVPYWSHKCSQFGPDEADWMIFEIDNKCKYLSLTKLKIKNHANRDGKSGVKEMSLEIGKNFFEWIECNPPIISVSKETRMHATMQSFDIRSDYVENAMYIRVKFLTNHGHKESELAKFVVSYIELHGIQIE